MISLFRSRYWYDEPIIGPYTQQKKCVGLGHQLEMIDRAAINHRSDPETVKKFSIGQRRLNLDYILKPIGNLGPILGRC